MRLQDEPEIQAQINIVPMIDVIFAILTFFIMSTLFLTRSEGLSVNLPQSKSAQTQPKAPITVTIDAKGQLAVNRKPTQLQSLNGELRQLAQPNQEALVIVNADKSVNHGQVVSVMDVVRQLPNARLAIATQRE
ncbi:biopolymer transporter ExbD [Chroococcidiopsis sp. FACHB-1243]|uniref:ExbD/TolR family protein n=1 Tax=Chroococcidiopsis sp. [FACHB-1243] TaxID=2692781 RepID=UPI001780ECC6|nr:biopolymer transporter ExbD [Chroococcidiopsis sp. [FACHB-1243]]MBD2309180.1 biopolymer transporter ExbD [Chroococcidiopsis sp. [FACHB-1243]]